MSQDHPLVTSLRRLDPLIQFLTRATGETTVPLSVLRKTLPSGFDADSILKDLQRLADIGVIQITKESDCNVECNENQVSVGFPEPSCELGDNLNGSTKTAAKRRLAALQRVLRKDANEISKVAEDLESLSSTSRKIWTEQTEKEPIVIEEPTPTSQHEKEARRCLEELLGFSTEKAISRVLLPTCILPKQASYAGTHPASDSVFDDLPDHILNQIPSSLRRTLRIDPSNINYRRPYSHQTKAIVAAFSDTHVSICTGTGSGKSLSFLVPTLTHAFNNDSVSLLLFPTKALAQDQLSKLLSLISPFPELVDRIRPATLDGDTPHANRPHIASVCNIIMTNPDTLHAAILPAWRSMYKGLLQRLKYVVIDEAHTYEGHFGAHVALILSRLVRVVGVVSERGSPTFISLSATLPGPEQHFRLLCPISSNVPVAIVSEDGSPRSAKHFFAWNPPVLKTDGTCTGKVFFTQPLKSAHDTKRKRNEQRAASEPGDIDYLQSMDSENEEFYVPRSDGNEHLRRRHAADETALLLAKAMSNGIRCIAFCKTRNLVEWVYEKAISALKKDTKTSDLTMQLESYRGGYTMTERRKIEERLFRNELLGVVATNALELGVDIGGIDLTLHCGYPSSYASLLQQAGRAGRGGDGLNLSSCAMVVCFNSPSEQHLWRHPHCLFAKSLSSSHTIPMNGSLVQGHLLCASEEYPLTGSIPTSCLHTPHKISELTLSDHDLFGGRNNYDEALEVLCSTGSVVEEYVSLPSAFSLQKMNIFKAHPTMKKAWSRVSIRSIEPVNYAVVDISHPGQAGKNDGIYDENAIMDILPYSRVFYHAHPGAIITHRGRKFKVVAMTKPPAFIPDHFGYRRGLNLAAFAKPTKAKYSTRPLSNLHITVTKQFEHEELPERIHLDPDNGDKEFRLTTTSEKVATDIPEGIRGSHSSANSAAANNAKEVLVTAFAGCGAVNVKRTVHGYKKLSFIDRSELSRTELSLPDMEYDSFGIWIDTDIGFMSTVCGDRYGPGVHALSHAILAVAPIFIPGLVRTDLECDHAFVSPTRVMLFDERAGGSGAVQNLWKHFFKPNSILHAAIDLLEECASCRDEKVYDGGCPACLHASQCLKFNMHLSRSAGTIIGKRMLERIKQTYKYRSHNDLVVAVDTPRRKARAKALREAKEMKSSRDKQYVVGRPSWPLSCFTVGSNQENED